MSGMRSWVWRDVFANDLKGMYKKSDDFVIAFSLK